MGSDSMTTGATDGSGHTDDVFTRLPYGVVVRVMAALSRNGGEKIGLVTDPLK